MTIAIIHQSRALCPGRTLLQLWIKLKMQDHHLVVEDALHINKGLKITLGLAMDLTSRLPLMSQTFLKKPLVSVLW